MYRKSNSLFSCPFVLNSEIEKILNGANRLTIYKTGDYSKSSDGANARRIMTEAFKSFTLLLFRRTTVYAVSYRIPTLVFESFKNDEF